MDFRASRHNMVEGQIKPNHVTDPLVIDAMNAIPREVFVPKALRDVAYVDEAIAVADGRYLMEPMLIARLMQALAVQPDDVVLDVGCATGYTSALLARIAATVVALESDKALAAAATELLTGLEIDNVAVVEGPLAEGYPRQAPYDVVFLGGAVAEIPSAFLDQLAEGGRLAAVVQAERGPGRVVLCSREDGRISRRTLFESGVPFLPGFAPRPAFRF